MFEINYNPIQLPTKNPPTLEELKDGGDGRL